MSEWEPCPTCGRTYGIRVEDPNRCGCCLTGLSLDGRPVHPVQGPDGKWYDPIVPSRECAQLSDGTWTILFDAATLAVLGWTREKQIAAAEARRAAGE